jgi:hypothetical protein
MPTFPGVLAPSPRLRKRRNGETAAMALLNSLPFHIIINKRIH